MKRKNKFFSRRISNFGPSSTASTIECVSLESIPPFQLVRLVKPFLQAENFTGVCRIDLSQSDLWITHVVSALR